MIVPPLSPFRRTTATPRDRSRGCGGGWEVVTIRITGRPSIAETSTSGAGGRGCRGGWKVLGRRNHPSVVEAPLGLLGGRGRLLSQNLREPLIGPGRTPEPLPTPTPPAVALVTPPEAAEVTSPNPSTTLLHRREPLRLEARAWLWGRVGVPGGRA